jgi:siroheme synthase-like protein
VAAPDSPLDYPVVLTLEDRPCLVVGAGPIAARRAEGLLGAGAEVVVVAPEISESMGQLAKARSAAAEQSGPAPGRLTVQRRPYRPGEAAAYTLVATATGDPEVDALVVDDATAAGVLVASANRVTPGSIRLPAMLRHGPVTIAVSTGGVSPRLAGWIRDRIATALPPELDRIAALAAEGRVDEAEAELLRVWPP